MNHLNLNNVFISLLSGLLMWPATPLFAESTGSDLSYSYEQWPSRWSSAIRQQQGGKYPVRQQDQVAPPELPEAISDQDLFSSPSQRKRYGRTEDHSRFDRRTPGYHFSRRSTVHPRDAAVAYQPSFYNGSAAMYGGEYFSQNHMGYGAMIDPVLGHPGVGIPVMPGVPMGYPIGIHPYAGMPYGYPGSMSTWNPPFGFW